MKIFTLLSLVLFMSVTLSAQFVIVNSPESLEGAKNFDAAGFGADISTDVWTADAVFVDDGTANPNEGCEAPMNAAELAGKIAMIDRGSCEFGVKCLNAEEAGAIAAIVFNSEANAGAGTIVMGGGAQGGNVTIPCVMLSYEDGQEIRTALMSGAVNITIGNVQFPNDIGSNDTGILRAPYGVIPASQSGNYIFTPGAVISNNGTNDASNVSVNATIESGGSTVYDETGTIPMLESDSTSDLLILPEFDPADEPAVYDVTYTIASDSMDNPLTTADNSFTSQFILSENIYTKAGWDMENDRPVQTNAYTIAGGGPIEFIAPFDVPNGMGSTLDSVEFYVSTSAATFLADITVEAYVYDWEDMNEDSTMNNDEMNVVALATLTFPSDETATDAWLTLPLIDLLLFEEGYPIEENDEIFAVGVRYQGTELTFFGFDENYDQTQYSDNLAATDADLPYIGVNAWTDIQPDVDGGFLFTGVRGSVATALIMGITTDVEDVVGPDVLEINIFPNPVKDQLTAQIQLKEASSFMNYIITDNNGRVISMDRRNNIMEDQPTFDVSELPAGQYYFTVKTEAGHQTKPFVIQK